MARKSSDTHTKEGHPKIVHRKASGRFKPPPPKQSGRTPRAGSKPLAAAELDQDPGGGYNTNHDQIQE